MSFCAVCGRDHEPGPCPIPSVTNDDPEYEVKQYRRLGWGGATTGILILVLSQLLDFFSYVFLTVGLLVLLAGAGCFYLAQKSEAE